MAANGNGVDFRDYIRVVFAHGWWILFITLGVTGGMIAYTFGFISFARAPRLYEARNAILITDKFSGSLAKNMGQPPSWITRARKAELDLKRAVQARRIIEEAATSVGVALDDGELDRRAEKFKDEMKLEYTKEADFVKLSYHAEDGALAAAVLSIFMNRMIASCVENQVVELNNEVETLGALRMRLAADVGAAQRKLDDMKTVAPELRLTAATMALLRSGQRLTALPSTDQAAGVYVELMRDIITVDGEMADIVEQMEQIRRQIAGEPESVPAHRRLETLPAVREAAKKRDELRLQLAQLLANSTAEHPLVKKLQGELKGLDAFMASAATEATVEVVYEANLRRRDLQSRLATLQSDLAGLGQRKAKMEENRDLWREKLGTMSVALREAREATIEYENKSLNLTAITDQLVQAQIRRTLQLEQVGAYYKPEHDLTPVPANYRNKHGIHMILGVILGLVTSVFVVYGLEFADHSVRDQRDVRLHTKAAVLGVISDYNQMRAVASRAAWARAAGLKQYALAALLLGLAALLAWTAVKNWPRPGVAGRLPAALSAETVSNIEEAMRMYTAPAALDLDIYTAARRVELDVVPAVTVPGDEIPMPRFSE